MEIISVTGSIPTKRVVIQHASTIEDDKLVNLAIFAARESKSSLFGWSVTRHDDNSATVALHTD